MAMQDGLITGHQGNAAIGSGDAFETQLVQVTQWQATWENDIYPADVFGDATNVGHKSIRGMYRVRGSLTFHPAGVPITATGGHANFAPDGATPALSTLTLTERTNHTWSGEARLFNIQLTVNKGSGLNQYTADFESDGNWTVTET